MCLPSCTVAVTLHRDLKMGPRPKPCDGEEDQVVAEHCEEQVLMVPLVKSKVQKD